MTRRTKSATRSDQQGREPVTCAAFELTAVEGILVTNRRRCHANASPAIPAAGCAIVARIRAL